MNKDTFIALLTHFLNDNEEYDLYLLGSGNLMLQGIKIIPRDIDLITSDQTIKALSKKYDINYQTNETGYLELKLRLDDHEIHVVSNNKNPLRPEDLESSSISIAVNGRTIQCLSLESEKHAYLQMGRSKDIDKINLINSKITYTTPKQIMIREINHNDLLLREKWLNNREVASLIGFTGSNTTKSNREWFNTLGQEKRFFTILTDSIPVGFVGLNNITENQAEIFIIIGEKDYWNQGIGKYALEQIMATASELGIRKLLLSVSKENLRALNLYKKFGFKITNTQENEYYMELTV